MPVGAYSDSTIHVPAIELRTPLPLDTAPDTRPLIAISRFACQYCFDCGVGSRAVHGCCSAGAAAVKLSAVRQGGRAGCTECNRGVG